jgi:nucleoside-diphosphate-sugar epimerase
MPITLLECKPRIEGACVMVTGGAGFIGSHLVDYLLEHGARQVVVVDDLTRPRLDWLAARKNNSQVRFVEGSILDALDLALRGVDMIFHLAAVATVMDAVRDPERTFAVNAMGTARLAMAAHRAGVRRFVFSSSREVYGDPESLPVSEDTPMRPKNVYGASKAAGEMFLSTLNPSDIEVVILRLANVYGPGDRGRVIPQFLSNALNATPLTLYGGQQSLDLIWIGDVVETLVKAGFSETHVAEPVNIGSGTSTPLKALAERIVTLVGNDTPLQIAPPRGPEVERYQADLRRAEHYFGLRPKDDPLDRLPGLLGVTAKGPASR